MDPFRIDNPKIELDPEYIDRARGYLGNNEFALFKFPDNKGHIGMRYLSRERGEINIQFFCDQILFSLKVVGNDTHVLSFHPLEADISEQHQVVTLVMNSINVANRTDEATARKWFEFKDIGKAFTELSMEPMMRNLLRHRLSPDGLLAKHDSLFRDESPLHPPSASEIVTLRELVAGLSINALPNRDGGKSLVRDTSNGIEVTVEIYSEPKSSDLTLVVIASTDDAIIAMLDTGIRAYNTRTGEILNPGPDEDLLMFRPVRSGDTYKFCMQD